MKYIDEKRMRFGYIGIFAIAVLLIGAALWDTTYNDERMLNWLISALGGLLLIAIFFFIATELILKDALDLRPKRIAATTDQDPGVRAGHNTIPTVDLTRTARKAEAPADSAASLSMMDRPSPSEKAETNSSLSSRITSEAWHPHVQPAVKKAEPKREPTKVIKVEVPPEVKIDLPQQVTIDAKPKPVAAAPALQEKPSAIPKPKNVQPAPQGLKLEPLAYELGSSQFRIPRGSKGHRNPNAVLESTRILCADCGLYFRVDLDRTRPISVPCPQCTKDLGLSGAKQDAEHIRMRCRFCGDFLQMPRVAEHHATQCATCGQING